MKVNLAYAGIGSRGIDEAAKIECVKLARQLSEKGFTVYSGNADGADISFQAGAGKNSVAFLPWKNFNYYKYNADEKCGMALTESSHNARRSVDQFHPNPASLSYGARKLMERNYFQIYGCEKSNLPKVSFVVCYPLTSYRDENGKLIVAGGTGQAVKIAQSLNIPVISMTESDWKEKLEKIIDSLPTF